VAVRQVVRPTAAPAPVAVPFIVKAGKTHVEVTATDKALGMRELLQVMQKDANLSRCVIEECSFDGELFQARLRIAA
jgi:hypothetical protein